MQGWKTFSWHKRLRLALWAAVVVAAAASVGLALARPASPARGDAQQLHSVFVGKTFPALSLQDLDGRPAAVAGLAGRPALVNFWATRCIPCRAEMPDIEHEFRAWKGRVSFVGVDDGEDVAAIRGFIQELGISYPIWRDPQADVEKIFDAPGLPYTVFVDRSSRVKTVFLGQMSRGYMEQQLRQLSGSG